jgi:uncharacterized protein
MSRIGILVSATMLALLLAAGGLLAYLIPVASRPASPVGAQSAPTGGPPTIVVGAEGSASAQPDQATISVGAQAVKPTAAEALAEANRLTTAVLTKLTELGVPRANIQTSSINLFPVQEEKPGPGGGEPTITGYRAINQVTVLLDDLAKVGPVLDGAVTAGANQVNFVRFSIKDDAALRARAIQQAVAAARPRADAIAGGMNLKADQVVEIRDDAATGVVVPAAELAQRGGGTPIEPGQLTARARVQVTFSLVPVP